MGYYRKSSDAWTLHNIHTELPKPNQHSSDPLRDLEVKLQIVHTKKILYYESVFVVCVWREDMGARMSVYVRVCTYMYVLLCHVACDMWTVAINTTIYGQSLLPHVQYR